LATIPVVDWTVKTIHIQLAQQINYITSDWETMTRVIDGRAVPMLQAYDIELETVITLCGGVPSLSVTTYDLAINYISDTTIQCTIATNLYSAVRRINFGLRVIFNDFLEVENAAQGRGLGTRLLCNQVKMARNIEFRRLDVTAQGPDGSDTEWQGYYTWGRLGFQMDQEDHEDLMAILSRIGRPETCLWDLLRHTEGQDLWRRDGFTWHGSFDLQEGSQSLKWLKQYLADKQKNYDI
jgi:hypothetical protein